MSNIATVRFSYHSLPGIESPSTVALSKTQNVAGLSSIFLVLFVLFPFGIVCIVSFWYCLYCFLLVLFVLFPFGIVCIVSFLLLFYADYLVSAYIMEEVHRVADQSSLGSVVTGLLQTRVFTPNVGRTRFWGDQCSIQFCNGI